MLNWFERSVFRSSSHGMKALGSGCVGGICGGFGDMGSGGVGDCGLDGSDKMVAGGIEVAGELGSVGGSRMGWFRWEGFRVEGARVGWFVLGCLRVVLWLLVMCESRVGFLK